METLYSVNFLGLHEIFNLSLLDLIDYLQETFFVWIYYRLMKKVSYAQVRVSPESHRY